MELGLHKIISEPVSRIIKMNQSYHFVLGTNCFKGKRKGFAGGDDSDKWKRKKLRRVDIKFLRWFLLRIYNW